MSHMIKGRGEDTTPATYTPNEEKDTLHSKAIASLLYCLGEGEWAGLVDGKRSVYINSTPLQGPDGFNQYRWENSNYYLIGECVEPSVSNGRIYKCTTAGVSGTTEPTWGVVAGGTTADGTDKLIWTEQTGAAAGPTYNFPGIDPIYRWGTIDQTGISGFSNSETEIQDGRELKRGSPGALSLPTISDSGVDVIRVTMGFPNFTESTAQGDVRGAGCAYQFELQETTGGPWGAPKVETLTGKTTTRYQRTTSIRLTGVGPWTVRVTRLTDDSTSLSLNNRSFIDSYSLVVEEKLSHPGVVLAAVTANAKMFSQIPQIAFECNMLKVSVPDNYTPRFWTPAVGVTPGFWTEAHYTSDMWTGTMTTGANKKHTANPAWILYDLLTNVDYGLGKWIKPAMVNKWALYKIAGYCDGLVDVVSGGVTTKEPRFTCNLYLASAEEAYKVIENLCSIFRGMAYWSSGSVFAVDDSEQDPVYEYTCSNVTEEGFNYSTPERRQRHNVAMVAWNDPVDGYRQKVEYVQDMDGIVALGRVYKTNVVAFGCTSQGQAQRFGRAILYTERFGEIVNFKTGFEGMRSRPGDPILIQDQFRDQVRLGGRVISSDGTNHVLDSEVTLTGGDKLNIVLPTGIVQERAILSASGATVTTPAFDFSPGPMCQWLIVNTANEAKRYRVFEVKEDGPDTYSISALTEDEGKWAYIDAEVTIPTNPDPPPGPNPNPGGALMPKNIALTVIYPNDGVIVNPKIAVSWDPIDRAKYHISWRKGSGNWTEEAIVMANAAEILNCPPDTYAVKVYAHLDNLIGPPGLAVVVIEDKTADLDDWLTPGQKHDVKSDWDVIIAEQTDLDARAATNGVSATAYDAAITALTAFLNLQIGTGGWASGDWTDYTTTFCLNPHPWQVSTVYAATNRIQPTVANLHVYACTTPGTSGATEPTWNTGSGSTTSDNGTVWTEQNPETGVGGGLTLRAKFTAVYTQRAALLAAIIAVASQPSDTFRPAIMWDMGTTTLDSSWTMTDIAVDAASSPYGDVARKWTWGHTHTPALTPCSPVFNLTGKAARVIMARVRLISGTWVGKAYFKGTSPSVTAFTSANYKQAGAPVVGGNFQDIAWDMAALTAGTTNYVSNTAITQIAMDFGDEDAVVEVDWIAVGTYGAGSKMDYNAAVAEAATTAMQNADWLSGGMFDCTNVLPGSITTPSLAAGIIFANNMFVADMANLVPNGNSEKPAPSGGWPAGSLESAGIYSGSAYRGTCCRCRTSTNIVISPTIPVIPGEIYSYMAYIYGTGELQVQYSSDGGVTWGSAVTPTALNAGGSFSHTGTSYANTGTIFQPDVTYTHFRATLTGSGTTYYDDIYLRRALNSQLVVDGAIQASAIVAGAVQTYHLSVGPHYQFIAKASGTPLMLNNDGTFSANSSANADENDTDAATYMDDQRIYPEAITKSFEANFSGNQARGFLINMASAFGAETTGLRILHSTTSLTVSTVSGASGRTYSAALAPTTGSTTVTSAGVEKLTAIYSGASGTSDTRRLVLKLSGVEVATYSDAAIGATYQGRHSGYAGIILGATAVRPGDVRIWGISLGIGSVTIQDGVVTADSIAASAVTAEKLTADLVMTNIIRSTGYTAGTSANAPGGFKLSGGTFTSTLMGGVTVAANMEIGSAINLGGELVGGVINKVKGNTITLSGAGSWTCPEGVTWVKLRMVPGGGGGAGGNAGNTVGGGGGGAGGIVERVIVTVPGTAYSYSVGAGGAGGAANTDGVDGANTTFGTHTAYGGHKGLTITTGGAGGNAVDASGAITIAGAPANDVDDLGSVGIQNERFAIGWLIPGAGGGSSILGGWGYAGGANDLYSGGTSSAGVGGSAGGGGGASGLANGGNGGNSTPAAGSAGALGSGGGGGGYHTSGSTVAAGGNGGAGNIIISW